MFGFHSGGLILYTLLLFHISKQIIIKFKIKLLREWELWSNLTKITNDFWNSFPIPLHLIILYIKMKHFTKLNFVKLNFTIRYWHSVILVALFYNHITAITNPVLLCP